MFDALPETRGNGKLIRSRSLSTALLAHGIMIAVVVSAAFLARVDAGEDPPKPYELVRVIPLEIPQGTSLEAGGGGRPEKPPAPPKEPEAVPPEPTQPVVVENLPAPVPVTAPEPAALTPSSSTTGNEGDGGLGGNGKGGGKGDSIGPGIGGGDKPGIQGLPEGVGEPGTDIYIVTGPVEPPVLILKVQPEYPEIARQARKEGNVILQAVIGTDGHVESVSILRSEPLFDKAAMRAVSQWIYRPAKLNGLPVKVFFTVYVEFRLN